MCKEDLRSLDPWMFLLTVSWNVLIMQTVCLSERTFCTAKFVFSSNRVYWSIGCLTKYNVYYAVTFCGFKFQAFFFWSWAIHLWTDIIIIPILFSPFFKPSCQQTLPGRQIFKKNFFQNDSLSCLFGGSHLGGLLTSGVRRGGSGGRGAACCSGPIKLLNYPPCHAECVNHPAEVILAALNLLSYCLSLPKACYYKVDFPTYSSLSSYSAVFCSCGY